MKAPPRRAHASGAPDPRTSASIVDHARCGAETNRRPTVALRPDRDVQQTTLRKLAARLPAPRRTSSPAPTAGTGPDQTSPQPFSDTENVFM